jgi:hypothetical protein
MIALAVAGFTQRIEELNSWFRVLEDFPGGYEIV